MCEVEDYRIVEVLDAGTKLECKKYSYRKGRICSIDRADVEIGRGLFVFYPSGDFFSTSRVLDFVKDDKELIVSTLHRIYRFERLI